VRPLCEEIKIARKELLHRVLGGIVR
jgi:hypothetical protein